MVRKTGHTVATKNHQGRIGKGKEKLRLHPRNPHRARYNFPLLADSCPELAPFVKTNQYGNQTIDFADANAVKALNKALLNHFYGVTFWDIPEGYLCPPIPGRADYIHYLADLLADTNGGHIPRGKQVRVLDVGTGANCVYPIVATKEYGWHLVGSDVNPIAIGAASAILQANASLKKRIQLRQQPDESHIFQGIWGDDDYFDLTLCNPPFHASEATMTSENRRKWRGLKGDNKAEATLNFGGQAKELWCDGGEVGFLLRMIDESVPVGQRCLWFTSLVARKDNLAPLQQRLQQIGAKQVRIIEMAQGQKVSRFIAWSFFDTAEQQAWCQLRWKS
jgi:23S rRNA (adenine1618-N6)-methyltransferase